MYTVKNLTRLGIIVDNVEHFEHGYEAIIAATAHSMRFFRSYIIDPYGEIKVYENGAVLI